MSADAAAPRRRGMSPAVKRGIWIGVVVVVLVAMFLDTKRVDIDSTVGQPAGAFSPDAWATENFSQIQSAIEERAVDATTLAKAVQADPQAAAEKYGVETGTGSEVSVKFTGVAGKGQAGIYPVTVDGVPKSILIRIQTGPAINGTDLRDAPGTIEFGQFTNQIDYQNAGAALNKQLKQEVLSKVDTANLQGKTVSVVGAFQLINPDAWLVTPVKLEVQ